MSVSLTFEQLEIRDSVRAFLGNEFSDPYLQTQLARSTTALLGNWEKIKTLGFHEAFVENSGSGGWSEVELWIVAKEFGRALVNEPLLDDLIVRSRLQSFFANSFVLPVNDICLLHIVNKEQLILSSSGKFLLSDVDCYNDTNSVLLLVKESEKSHLYFVAKTSVADAKVTKGLDLIFPQGCFEVDLKNAAPIELNISECRSVVAWKNLSISAQLAGMAEKVFEQTLDYTNFRKQFEVPISSFQVIQHRLAEQYLKVQALNALSLFSAQAGAQKQEQFYFSTLASLVYANQNVVSLMEAALQLYGGIGFTWEHTLHLYLRRAISLKFQSEKYQESLVDVVRLKEGIL